MTFQERLRFAMDRAGVSNTELASRMGVSVQAVGKWLKKGQIHRDRLFKLAKYLNVSSAWLLQGDIENTAVAEDHGTYKAESSTNAELTNLLPLAPKRAVDLLSEVIHKVQLGELTTDDLEAIWPLIERLSKKGSQD